MAGLKQTPQANEAAHKDWQMNNSEFFAESAGWRQQRIIVYPMGLSGDNVPPLFSHDAVHMKLAAAWH